jgi:hypothetical protein
MPLKALPKFKNRSHVGQAHHHPICMLVNTQQEVVQTCVLTRDIWPLPRTSTPLPASLRMQQSCTCSCHIYTRLFSYAGESFCFFFKLESSKQIGVMLFGATHNTMQHLHARGPICPPQRRPVTSCFAAPLLCFLPCMHVCIHLSPPCLCTIRCCSAVTAPQGSARAVCARLSHAVSQAQALNANV